MQLQFITEAGQVGETVFANYIPVKMVKEVLASNGFFTKLEWERILDEEGPEIVENENVDNRKPDLNNLRPPTEL